MRRTAFAGALVLAGLALSGASPGHPDADRPAFEVLTTSGAAPRPCPSVHERSGFVAGGCRATGYAFQAGLTIRTAFGAMPFGQCVISFDFVLDRGGRIRMDRLRIGGGSPCNDAVPCAPASVLRPLRPGDSVPLAARTPWKGRIVTAAENRYGGYVDLCIDTCAGQYRGRTRVALVRGGDAWSLRASAAGVGVTALELDGNWTLRDAAFDIEGGSR